MDGDGQRASPGEDSEDILLARFMVPAYLRRGRAVVDREGTNFHGFGREIRRFQQGRAKRQEMRAGTGGALREKRDRLFALECLGDGDRLVLRAPAMAA